MCRKRHASRWLYDVVKNDGKHINILDEWLRLNLGIVRSGMPLITAQMQTGLVVELRDGKDKRKQGTRDSFNSEDTQEKN
jgi:hypothetical protein